MNRLTFVFTGSVLLAVFLGYYMSRVQFESASAGLVNSEMLPVRNEADNVEVRAKATAESDFDDANTQSGTNSAQELVITSEHESSRDRYIESWGNRLEEFFLINGISSERANQITRGLVDVDYYISLKQKGLIDRHASEATGLGAQGDIDQIVLTDEEKAGILAEQELLYRQVINEHYEAYEEYERTYLHRNQIGVLSSSFEEPLDHAAKESLIQILHEETSRLESELRVNFGETIAHRSTTPRDWATDKERYEARLLGMRSYNDRVFDRARSY